MQCDGKPKQSAGILPGLGNSRRPFGKTWRFYRRPVGRCAIVSTQHEEWNALPSAEPLPWSAASSDLSVDTFR